MKKQKNNSKRKVSRLLGLGYLNFEFKLEITESDINNYNIDLPSINEIKDLEFIAKDNAIMDKIVVTSTSNLINTLLYINKSNKIKTFIELTSFNNFFFEKDDERFLKDIVTYVTEHNFIFLNETDISSNVKNINFVICVNGLEKKKFVLCKDDLMEKELNIKNMDQNKNKEIQETNKAKLDNVSNKENDEKSTKRTRSIQDFISKLPCSYNQFEYIYIDIDDILNNLLSFNSNSVTIEEITHLVIYLYSNFPNLKIIIKFPDVLSNINLVNYEFLNNLNILYGKCDVFLFDKKEALAGFNLINQLNNNPAAQEKIKASNESQLEKVFLSTIEEQFLLSKKRLTNTSNLNCVHSNALLSTGKIALFLEDMLKAYIVQISKCNNIVMGHTFSFNLDLYPRINHSNQKLVDEYKKQIVVNKNYLKSVFYGSFISRIILNYNINSAISAGCDLSKRILDLFKLELDFPSDPEFYVVNTKKTGLNEIVKKKKEDNFKLDCVNINKSKLDIYNPLKDNNLYSYFSSNVIRKHLKEAGFINTKGFILDDPEKQINCSPKKMNNKLDNDREKKLLIAIKENENRNNKHIKKHLIHKSKVLQDTSIRELEKQYRIKEYSPDYNMLLPSYAKNQKLKPIKGYNTLHTNSSNIDKTFENKVSNY